MIGWRKKMVAIGTNETIAELYVRVFIYNMEFLGLTNQPKFRIKQKT